MPQSEPSSLWSAVDAADSLPARFLSGADAKVALGDLIQGSALKGDLEQLRGRSIMIATAEQLPAALALIELDGVARRIVVWPFGAPLEHLPFVLSAASVDTIVSDGTLLGKSQEFGDTSVACNSEIVPMSCDRRATEATEWILLTSGTTGRPKMVLHTLASLCGAIKPGGNVDRAPVWSTFYDIRRYGGLQIFLRAMLTGGSMVLSSAEEPVAQFLIRAGVHGVSHISGTPSHWRRALMSPEAAKISPEYVRLSGEIADQAILDSLRSFYPQARVAHAFASTEAGVAFDVRDGLAGFPASLMGEQKGAVEMKVQDGTLRIRSPRIAARYIEGQTALADAEGFVDTGDMVELRGGRFYFAGRRDGTINIGGQKVHPEEVESVINRHPRVRMSLVRPRKNPLLGALIVAEVVLETGPASDESRGIENEILQLCRSTLPQYKVPAFIKVVTELAVASTGKIVRQHA